MIRELLTGLIHIAAVELTTTAYFLPSSPQSHMQSRLLSISEGSNGMKPLPLSKTLVPPAAGPQSGKIFAKIGSL